MSDARDVVVTAGDMLAELDRAADVAAGRIFAPEHPVVVVSESPRSVNSVDAFGGPPTPLRPVASEPPIDLLPAVLADQVRSTAGHLQTPIEAPLSYVLGAVAAAAAPHFSIRYNAAYSEPLNLWTVVVMRPSERKTATEQEAFRAVREWEQEERERTWPERQRRRDRCDVLEKRAARLQDAAAKADDPDRRDEALHELAQVREQIGEIPPSAPLRLLVGDCTPERLVGIMSENGGHVALASAEPGIFQMMAGRYADQEQSEVFRQAWSGERIIVDRQGRDGDRVEDSGLVIAIAAQPASLEHMKRRHELRGLGTLARFLWWMPESRVGRRAVGRDVPKLDTRAARAYRRTIHRILDTAGEHTLELGTAARNAFDDWWAKIERDLRPGSRLADIDDWGGKLHGQTLRVAGVLHVARHDSPELIPVGVEDMEAAVGIARAASDHAAAVFGMLERPDDDIALAEYVWSRIDGNELTVRELMRRCGGKTAIKRADELRDLLSILERHGYVRVEVDKRAGPGRPSEIVTPNPILRNGMTKLTERAASEGSVNSVNANPGSAGE